MHSNNSTFLENQLQYLAANDFVCEPEVDIREISFMLLADAVHGEVYGDNERGEFFWLRKELFRAQEDICDTFENAITESGIDIEPELSKVDTLVSKIIQSINDNLENFTFTDMWKESPKCARREVLRAIADGVSFWDDYEHEDFGQLNLPKIGYFEAPHCEAYDVLTKLVSYIRSQLQ